MIQYSHLNGKLIATQDGNLNLNDLAILRGYGVFDYFCFFGKQVLFWEDYLDRFVHSARLLHLELPFDKAQLRSSINELIAANQVPEGAIRMVATGGYAHDGYTPTTSNFMILQYPLPAYPETYHSDGVRLLSYPYQREIPRAKSLNYLIGISVLQKLKAAKAIEVLYHDGRFLRETDRANFFLITPDGKLVTPVEKILWGITRKSVLGVARKIMPVEEREVAVEEMQTAAEAFLTSSTRGVMPVVRVDDQVIGNGKPGPWTQQLIVGLKQAQQSYLAGQEALINRQS